MIFYEGLSSNLPRFSPYIFENYYLTSLKVMGSSNKSNACLGLTSPVVFQIQNSSRTWMGAFSDLS